ncbi:MAG: flagellar biosynthesis protein FlhB [Mesorhizobium amorphae]|nr:MAG: flagellar biosynthesis protein FlhB [Mesorhizobium amorphae]
MAGGEDKDSKTEEPTEKKIRDTVEEGKLPHSKEAALVASFGAILVFTLFFASQSVVELGRFLAVFLEKPEDWPLSSERDVETLLSTIAAETGRTAGLLLVMLVAAGVLASVFQHMPTMVGERIRPQWSRVSPAAGWKRLFGVQGWVEFAKSVVKMLFATLVAWWALGDVGGELLAGLVSHPDSFGHAIESMLARVVVSLTLAMVVVAAADFAWQRFSWRRDLRMTKQEIKDEMKQSEGDPIVKSRLRSIQRDRARNRMMAAVPKATLVIANPTHFSIALRYVAGETEAPIVLAKGQDLVALKIRGIAAEHGIPVFEDVGLARSMYKQVSVDTVIPPQFYQAVAELVRVVYARNGGAGNGRTGSGGTGMGGRGDMQ